MTSLADKMAEALFAKTFHHLDPEDCASVCATVAEDHYAELVAASKVVAKILLLDWNDKPFDRLASALAALEADQ